MPEGARFVKGAAANCSSRDGSRQIPGRSSHPRLAPRLPRDHPPRSTDRSITGGMVISPPPTYAKTAARHCVIPKGGKIGHSLSRKQRRSPRRQSLQNPPEKENPRKATPISPLLRSPRRPSGLFLFEKSPPPAPKSVPSVQRKKPDRYSLGKTQKPKEPPAGPPARSELQDKICYKSAVRLPQLPYT